MRYSDNMTNSATPSVGQLKRAVELAEKIAGLQEELDSLLGRATQGSRSSQASQTAAPTRGRGQQSPEKGAATTAKVGKGSRRRTMSPEAREKIAAAQRARWAKQKKESSK